MTDSAPNVYSERLWPSPWLFAVLLLIIPATTLTIMPINQSLAVPIAIVLYAIITASLVLMSPLIRVKDGVLSAGRANVPVKFIGALVELDDSSLRKLIGPDADARAYLLVRGYIHRGVKFTLTDTNDPTPYWVITTRKPQTLIAAVQALQARTT